MDLLWTCIALGEVLKGVTLVAWAHFYLDWPAEVNEVVERMNEMEMEFKQIETEVPSACNSRSFHCLPVPPDSSN